MEELDLKGYKERNKKGKATGRKEGEKEGGGAVGVTAAAVDKREGDRTERDTKREDSRCCFCSCRRGGASLSSRAVAIADQDPSSSLFPAPPSRPALPPSHRAVTPRENARGKREKMPPRILSPPSMDEAEERDPRGREDCDLFSRRAQPPLVTLTPSSSKLSPDPPLLKLLAAPLHRWSSSPLPLPPKTTTEV
ncbi:uncharacterized protein LOC130946175 [Arachis stenosperma]|uniref:uncharacterized protein LOC130946175 n=1 Tax=Arachis stenosperma TaxID=217475 RepID=UPI0025AD78EC|nr:uncharacterized protein LOC130946175 [Arachis stenosperma]